MRARAAGRRAGVGGARVAVITVAGAGTAAGLGGERAGAIGTAHILTKTRRAVGVLAAAAVGPGAVARVAMAADAADVRAPRVQGAGSGFAGGDDAQLVDDEADAARWVVVAAQDHALDA